MMEDHGGLVVGTALRRVYSFVPLRQCALQRLKFLLMMSEDNIVTGDTDAGLPPHRFEMSVNS
jgi:hypothetical protein